MLADEILIVEFVAVDGFAAGSLYINISIALS